jgi:hypothetical protein
MRRHPFGQLEYPTSPELPTDADREAAINSLLTDR